MTLLIIVVCAFSFFPPPDHSLCWEMFCMNLKRMLVLLLFSAELYKNQLIGSIFSRVISLLIFLSAFPSATVEGYISDCSCEFVLFVHVVVYVSLMSIQSLLLDS